MTAAVETLFPGQDDIARGIDSMALSRSTVSKRIDVILTNLYETALSQLLQAEWFSLAIDDTTDIRDTAQLAVFSASLMDKNSLMNYFLCSLSKDELLVRMSSRLSKHSRMRRT